MSAEALLERPDVAHLARMLRERPGRAVDEAPDARRAAVALILRPHSDAELELLLIKRAEYEGDPWSGHIALPGGRREPADRSLEETAMRETMEETAIDLARDGIILGALDDLHPRTPVLPPIVIRPFVAVATPDVAVVPSEEVALAFWVPLGRFADPALQGDATVRVRGEDRLVPSFRHETHVIWGLTERVLRQFLSLAVAPF
jgi:8-oxo-dGTP pyrophosphatase MutT (NUDIX family)